MLLAFQWLQELKEKKKAQARAALGVRKSPRSHSVKVFYGESTASEEEKKTSTRTESPEEGKTMFTTKEGDKAGLSTKESKTGVPTEETKGTVLLDTVLGFNPKSSHIWFLDFFGFSLFSLAAPST